jgi:predicted SAM-dependent methyltransferase/predicted O-methyltransferase YrrM
MEFLIALQSHNKSNSQDNYQPYDGFKFKRYGCDDRTEVLKRCTRSLIKSINYAQSKLPDWKFKLNVFDDHSSDEGVQILKDNLFLANFQTSLNHIEGRGLMASLRECYENLREEGKDLVMQAQDDYLYDEECFYQVVQQWLKFQPKFPKPLSLLPYNDPYRYWDHNVVPVRIVQGPDRHWRQTYQVPCTFITHHKVVVDEWDLFDKICNGDPHDPKLEDESVNLLWQEREYVVMSPLPSLSLHFQTDNERDPYIDWKSWWDKFGDDVTSFERKEHEDLFNTDKKIVLNIGCGKTKLEYQSRHFLNWKEVRVDAFENDTADLITSIVDLNKVPNESVDCVWASHVVEHNYWHDLPNVFNNILRVLKSDGFAVIRVPDLGSIAHKIPDGLLEPMYESPVGPISPIDMIYGHRGFTQSWGEGMAHKTGFTHKSMEQLLAMLNIKSYVKSQNDEVVALIFKDEAPIQALADNELILSGEYSSEKTLNDVNNLEGWFKYYPYYNSIAKDIKNGSTIVEVGSWLGKSTVGIAMINKENNIDCKLYAVDTWEGSDEEPHKEYIDNLAKNNLTLYDKFMKNVIDFNVQDVIIPIKKTSEEASKDFEDESADIVIIDAAHDYDNVTNDIKHWLPKVKKGGILMGDDYDPDSWPEVVQAVKDYFGEGNYSVNEPGGTWYKIIE